MEIEQQKGFLNIYKEVYGSIPRKKRVVLIVTQIVVVVYFWARMFLLCPGESFLAVLPGSYKWFLTGVITLTSFIALPCLFYCIKAKGARRRRLDE